MKLAAVYDVFEQYAFVKPANQLTLNEQLIYEDVSRAECLRACIIWNRRQRLNYSADVEILRRSAQLMAERDRPFWRETGTVHTLQARHDPPPLFDISSPYVPADRAAWRA